MNHNQLSPWLAWLAAFEKIVEDGKTLRPVGEDCAFDPLFSTPAYRVLLVAPHPDDEAIEAPLALRLQDAGARITAAVVSLGSAQDRRQKRQGEFVLSCHSLGFMPLVAVGMPFSKILKDACPHLIVVPHGRDLHPSHQKVYRQVTMAARRHCRRTGQSLLLATTEYWRQMAAPNLLLGIRQKEAARVLAALACHAGETQRNPYHLRQPGRWLDNVRRGAELINGFGAHAPDFLFGEMYRILLINSSGMHASAERHVITPETHLAAGKLEKKFFPDATLP